MPDSPILQARTDDLAVPETVWMAELGRLLQELENVSNGAAPAPVITEQPDNQLVQVRLGIASSLYTALRCRHAPTAGHCLRVALSSSVWALAMGLAPAERDILEVAALLHDLGMISLPDRVLLKPNLLDDEEAHLVEQARMKTVEILRGACADSALLQTVENIGAWYDGFKGGYRLVGEQIPRGSRMIAIVEAFDAMITDHVFRPAMSLERALHELFQFAGSQFDPELVKQFVQLHACNQSQLRCEVAQRWLHTLDPATVNSYWELNHLPPQTGPTGDGNFFQSRLLDNMHDGVAFIDTGARIVQWNRGAERLTGICTASILQRQWSPSLLQMCNEKGDPLADDDCPVISAIRSGVQSLRRLTITGRTGRAVSVDSHAIPVAAEDGAVLGAILVLHDASPETSLEERCQTLHEKATKDPLTQVANRAEFDRIQEAFVRRFKEQGVPSSLMICDLDLFKQVNDNYGHQAGDAAIKSLATLLQNHCRPGDLVARYGGEEFVMLCADCDNAAATTRAEQLRQALAQLPQPMMDGRPVTASFGVTEVQPGDTPETMLRRADRGLLMAKAKGRNTVVQLGSGSTAEVTEEQPPEHHGWLSWRRPAGPAMIFEQDLATTVPLKVAIEKLRGFVADHCAKIVSIKGSVVQMEIDDTASPTRRRSDRPMTFSVELRFEDEQFTKDVGGNSRTLSRTKIHVTISPRKNRDRRRADVAQRAREVLASFRSYLMATIEDSAPGSGNGVLRRAKSILTPWLTQR
jgi:diguanylate cyclase (GGDEF)-like protein